MASRLTIRGKRGERGVSAVEAAIFIPLLFLLLFGMLEYSWVFLKTQQINNAARHCARMGIIEGATSADLMSELGQLMTDAELDASGYSVNMTPNDPSTLAPGQLLEVEITIPYANIELIGIPLLPTPATIVGRTSMAREAPQ